MIAKKFVIAFIVLFTAHATVSRAQTEKAADAATAPPKLLLLVHQQFKFGSETARQNLAARIARACNHLDVPNLWIELQSITGPPEALSFDPFDSFEQVDNSFVVW